MRGSFFMLFKPSMLVKFIYVPLLIMFDKKTQKVY